MWRGIHYNYLSHDSLYQYLRRLFRVCVWRVWACDKWACVSGEGRRGDEGTTSEAVNNIEHQTKREEEREQEQEQKQWALPFKHY